ncbi:unnamed protein product [Ambrosiozyma monospora]|uniref:Unnamed protein product n=1 Tax=Ambrosiozyma monospora TaxID=43982 RepID=A0ACB5T5U9_AMBMO|nr:unnamed protein product [Ambrosiozyma monospora]
MCAGVVDISRIFTRRKDHLNPEEVHKFSMKLYASYLSDDTQAEPFQLYPGMNPLLAMSMTLDNNGWGELIERIISGSNKGIAINPRLERLTFTIKELKSDSLFSEIHSDRAVDVIRTLSYDPMEPDYDRIYLKLVKVTDIKTGFMSQSRKKSPDFITAEVRSSSKQLKFSEASNEEVQSNWRFVSTTADEHTDEIIQITGLPTVPSNDNDLLYFDVYVNGVFHGEGRYPLKVFNQISDSELNSKRPKKVEIFSQNSTAPVGTVEITLEYIGKHYNIDTYIEMLLDWKSYYEKNLMNSEKSLITTLSKVRQSGVLTVVKYFPQLMANLLDIYCFASEKHQIYTVYGSTRDEKFRPLADAAFASIVHIIDMAIARQDEYIYLFDQLLETSMPKVGDFLLNDMNQVLLDFETKWNSTGRALCRVYTLLGSLALVTMSDRKSFCATSDIFLNDTLTKFMCFNNEALIADQLVLVNGLELILESLAPITSDYDSVRYVTSWTIGYGMRGIGAVNEVSTNALINKKKAQEHMLNVELLYNFGRFSRAFLARAKDSAGRDLLVSIAFSCALNTIFNPKIDIDSSRLAFGVILGVLEGVYENEYRFPDAANREIHVLFCRLLPVLCDAFNRYYDYCKSKKMLKPKRTFTQLFPSVYPFEEYTIDSHVKDESVCEPLIELTVLVIILCKVACSVEDSIEAAFVKPRTYTGNFAVVDSFLGSTSEYHHDSLSFEKQKRTDKNLSTITLWPILLLLLSSITLSMLLLFHHLNMLMLLTMNIGSHL